MKLTNAQRGVIALIIANLIWGAASPIFKWSLGNVEPFTLAFLRFFLAAYLLLPFCYNKLSMNWRDVPTIIIASFFGISVNIGFFFVGLEYAASINAPIIGSSGPVLLILASILFLRERPGKKVISGTFISLIGILLIILRPLLDSGVNLSIIGNLYFMFATIGAVINTILLKKITDKYHPITLAFWQFIIGSITFLPFLFHEITIHGFLPNLALPGISGILFGTILSSAIAYALSTYALKVMDASDTAIFTYMDPIIAVFVAIPLLGEKITFSYLFGSTLVFLGIFIAKGKIHYHLLYKLSKGLKSIL